MRWWWCRKRMREEVGNYKRWNQKNKDKKERKMKDKMQDYLMKLKIKMKLEI